MNRNPPASTRLAHALLVALLGAAALAGCKKDQPAAVTPPPAAEPAALPPVTTPAPMATASVTGIDLGNTVGADMRVATPMSTFATGDTIHASIATDGATAGTLTAKWTFQDGQVVDTQEKVVPAGPQVTDFSITKPDGWPAGTYKLEISNNGMVVQTREFEVQ